MLHSSYGTPWVSWPTGDTYKAHDETFAQGIANFPSASQQRPYMTQILPSNNNIKRKREDSSLGSPLLGSPVVKKRSETMSHVQIPAPDAQRILSAPHGDQSGGEEMLERLEESVGSASVKLGWEGALDSAQTKDQLPSASAVNAGPDHQRTATRRPCTHVVSRANLRDSIEAQFGLEILLKHKELRLIDQEFAKCQVGLEQLRRCEIIPYPFMSTNSGDRQAATSGSGPAFGNRAPYASPWDIPRGPYSRHYQRWLIPDMAFDDTVLNVKTPMPRGKTLPERATRGWKPDQGVLTGVSRSQRGSNSTRLKALPHGYPEPKEEKGPMIVKRSSDGKIVKLVCLDCRRSNFNSAQGFINHCRIAHSRQFLSHDAAIEASGEEIDAETEGGLREVNTGAQATASVGLVHPLIRSAFSVRTSGGPTESSTSSRRKKSQSATSSAYQASPRNAPLSLMTPLQQLRQNAIAMAAVQFNPSPQTPHLSALLARMGRGVDLHEAVTEATTKLDVDLAILSDDEGAEEVEDVAEQSEAPQSRSTRGVVRGGELPSRPRSVSPSEPSPNIRTPPKPTLQRPPHLPSIARHAPISPPQHYDYGSQRDRDVPMLDQQSPLNLSPNTMESHTAPSLVSDDGDYENTHSESEAPSDAEGDEHDDHYIHAEVMDHEDMDLGGGSSDHHLGLGGKPHSPTARRPSSAMRPSTAVHNEERHVSFASPQRRQRQDSKVKDSI